jgi:hypothetical protein
MVHANLARSQDPEIPLSLSSAHDPIDARSGTNAAKSWNRLGEQPTAILFLATAAATMAGWLYLMAEAVWAAADWLF